MHIYWMLPKSCNGEEFNIEDLPRLKSSKPDNLDISVGIVPDRLFSSLVENAHLKFY